MVIVGRAAALPFSERLPHLSLLLPVVWLRVQNPNVEVPTYSKLVGFEIVMGSAFRLEESAEPRLHRRKETRG
jgi:hypothetical protein